MKKLPKRTPRDAGFFLRILRAERNISQREAADLFGVSKAYWSLLESRKRNASPKLAERLAEATDAPMDIFLFATTGRRVA